MRSSLLLLSSVLMLAACDDSVCTRNSDCAHGLICGSLDTCVVPPDMATIDGGIDASITDLSVSTDLSDGGSEILDGNIVD